ncbi:MAG TPA: hypothetical protein DCF70_04710 [Treponema sp.]|nr:hypothetical protein [Treponema sp.]
MKKLSVLIIAAAALFAGCNNLTVEKNKDSKSGNVTINIGNQSRTISPMSGYSLSDFTNWTITFEEQNGFDKFFKTVTKDNLTFTVPAGLYTVTAESSYTPPVPEDGGSVATLTLTGTKTDVEIGANTKVNISVGLAKEKTGNFKYTLTGDVSSGYVSLVNMKKGGTSYSAEIQSADIQSEDPSEETSEEPALNAVYNGKTSELVVTGTGLKSGFYKLYVTDTPVVGVDNTGAVIYYDTDAVIYYDIGDFLVEIADDLETTGSASSVSESQTQVVYYGTNATKTGYNGKFPFARKNVNDILQLLITNKKWKFATIYMNTDVPELDVVVINQLRKAMTAGNRSESGDGYYVNIKGVSVDTLIDLSATKKQASADEASEGWTSCFTVAGGTELSLNAKSADENTDVSEKKLVIDNADAGIQTLTLKDGVTVTTSSLYGISEKLTVKLGDYNTYEKTPFLVYSDVESIPELSIDFADEGYVAAQKTESKTSDERTGGRLYTISWYARRAYSIEAGIDTATLDFNITTSAENTTTNGDITTIPIAADTKIVFETSPLAPDKSYTYAWYLTGNSATLLSMEPTYEFAPTTAKDFNFTDGEPIKIACVVSDDKGNWGSAVFEFVLTAAQSPIVLYNNQAYDTDDGSELTLGLAAFDKITKDQTIGTPLLEGAIRDFCFDGNCNLYVVTKVDSSYTIYKYTYSLFSGYSSESQTVATAAVDDAGGWQVVSCDTTNGYLFTVSDGQITVFVPGDQGYAEYPLEVPVDEIKADAPNLFSPTEGVTYSYSTEITNIAVSNHKLYIAMDVIQRGGDEPETAQIIARYTYSAPEGSGGSITLTLNGYVAAGKFKVFEDESEYPLTVNDMMVQDSKLYVLVSQQEGSSGSLRHRGALLTITDDNGSLSLTSTYGANTEYEYANDVLDAKTFYAPQKFLAVMPKKLVIADEGYIISDYSKFFVDGEAEFINRVVTVDLDNTDNSSAVNVNVSFDLYISIAGTPGSSTYINYQ